MTFNIKNFNIDKFNRDVNLSYNADEMYSLWKNYREELQSFLEHTVKNIKDKNSVAVLGAGSLNDIDVKYLCREFSEVTLIDTDTKSIEEGLLRHRLTKSEVEKISIVQLDFTGAWEMGFFKELERLVKKLTPAKKVSQYISEAIDGMKPEANLKHYSVVISCPVYTQLLYTQTEVFLKILHEYGLYEYKDLNLMLNAAYSSMPKILNRYNDMVLNMARDDGYVFMFTDIVEMKKESVVYRKLKKLDISNKDDIRKAEDLVKKYGIEISQVGLDDIFKKANEVDSAYLCWPFNQNKEYLVYCSALKINKYR